MEEGLSNQEQPETNQLGEKSAEQGEDKVVPDLDNNLTRDEDYIMEENGTGLEI